MTFQIFPQLEIPETLAAGPGPGNTDARVLQAFSGAGVADHMQADVLRGMVECGDHRLIHVIEPGSILLRTLSHGSPDHADGRLCAHFVTRFTAQESQVCHVKRSPAENRLAFG